MSRPSIANAIAAKLPLLRAGAGSEAVSRASIGLASVSGVNGLLSHARTARAARLVAGWHACGCFCEISARPLPVHMRTGNLNCEQCADRLARRMRHKPFEAKGVTAAGGIGAIAA
jgi:hypothetical protein